MRVPALLVLTALIAALGTAQATAARSDRDSMDERPTLRIRTSLGPIEDAKGDDEGVRALRAKGTAPAGSRITVRFYRGSRRLASERIVLKGSKRAFSTSFDIDRTGAYKVRVSARPPRTSFLLRATAKLDYGPGARAPSAPGNTLRP